MLELVERRGAGDPLTGSSRKWVRSGGRVAAGGYGVGVAGVANRNSKDISFVPFVYVLRTSAVKACLRRECC